MAIKSKKIKISGRERRKLRIRKSISSASVAVADARPRLTVFKSSQHMYAQVISDVDGKTIVAASTRETQVVSLIKQLKAGEENSAGSGSTKSVIAARAVGAVLAERCLGKNISKVVFDRNGFIYHGRVKAVADGAREKGLNF